MFENIRRTIFQMYVDILTRNKIQSKSMIDVLVFPLGIFLNRGTQIQIIFVCGRLQYYIMLT